MPRPPLIPPTQELLSDDCPNATTGACELTPVTVFAPTDAAFCDLAAQLNLTLPQLLQLPQLADILLFHITDPAVVDFPVMPSDLSDGVSIPTLYEDQNISVAYKTGLVPGAGGAAPLSHCLHELPR